MFLHPLWKALRKRRFCVFGFTLHVFFFFFFLRSRLFDTVTPQVGPAMFHYSNRKGETYKCQHISGEQKNYPGTKSKQERVNCLNCVCLLGEWSQRPALVFPV